MIHRSNRSFLSIPRFKAAMNSRFASIGLLIFLLSEMMSLGCNDQASPSLMTDGDTDTEIEVESEIDNDTDGDYEQEVETTTVFEHQIFVHTPDAQSGIATGDYVIPSISYPAIPIDAAYTNILLFQMTPWAFPLRRPDVNNGPVILFTDDFDVIVFSPMDHFFISLVSVADSRIEYGIEGEIDEIPEGFTHRYILVKGKGINATVEEWGRLLMQDRGISRRDRYADTGVSYLGYWTDNGATYFYNEIPGKNFEETLLAVKDEADELGIPYGYFQIDSQWYYRGPDTTTRKGGLYKWEPNPECFPDGLAAFRERLGLPLIAHNKWFIIDNAYKDDYPFVSGEAWSIPLGREVYDIFMRDAKAWGIETYEPDWLMSHIWEIPYLRQEIGRAEKWMMDQNDAAIEQERTMQLCMAGAAHLMFTLDMPAVTTFRTSIDYHAATSKESYWPMFHTVNMLASALGVMPFKDNFHSSETWGEQEALISNLSAGMVGVGDAIEEAKPNILQRTCRKDGVLLKPDKSATPLDAMFMPHQRPYTVSTYSDRGSLGRWTYLAAFHLARNHEEMSVIDEAFAMLTYDGEDLNNMFVWPDEVTNWRFNLEEDLGITERAVLYNWRSGEVQMVDASFDIPTMHHLYDYAYFIFAPILPNGLALIGETGKFVTLADKRFKEIESLENSIRVVVEGVPGEVVEIVTYDTQESVLLPMTFVTIGFNGISEVTISR